MEKDWLLLYKTDEEYKAVILNQRLTDHGLHPVLLNHKDHEFGIGQVEVFISPLELKDARKVMDAKGTD